MEQEKFTFSVSKRLGVRLIVAAAVIGSFVAGYSVGVREQTKWALVAAGEGNSIGAMAMVMGADGDSLRRFRYFEDRLSDHWDREVTFRIFDLRGFVRGLFVEPCTQHGGCQ